MPRQKDGYWDYTFYTTPKFMEYSAFLEQSLPEQCQSCPEVISDLTRLAMAVGKGCMTLNRRETRLVRIDEAKEEALLLEAQTELLDLVGDCEGPSVVEVDIAARRESMQRLTEGLTFLDGDVRARWLADINRDCETMLPVTTVCPRFLPPTAE